MRPGVGQQFQEDGIVELHDSKLGENKYKRDSFSDVMQLVLPWCAVCCHSQWSCIQDDLDEDNDGQARYRLQ